MDTATHTLMGGTLLGLATLDPSVDPLTLGFGATVIGASLIPDIDTILKMKNNAVYIKNHRGITHSIPFTFIIWPVLLATISHFAFGLPFVNMYFWSLLAVFLHVFVDIFNMYGTQMIRPLRNTWIQLGFINTIDIPIIMLLSSYLVLWFLGLDPIILFIIIYSIIAIYYIARYAYQQTLKRRVRNLFPKEEILSTFIMPTIKFFEWRVALKTEHSFFVGRAFKSQIVLYDQFDKMKPMRDDLYEIIKDDENFRSFTYFSSIYRYEITAIEDGLTEVRYIDLRYLKDGHYPFVCILKVNEEDKVIISSFTGWVFSEDKLQQKIK
ncbi:metal-dependent hydrolase [Phocicoccus pinnipedialis]|uniref:Inner membrane protein n=1 Tax=Phocicoccus pinnipedialis TaxID=110845 RepID=A0A6V7RNZ1_9BACL|nr:metal-dependent hydrolase [Jeotgalicoccus pinnipedialis]MBP1940251.1 inner membrane protein [Jeotgalicoccus pinnipedialis]CAD2079487.1 putative protein YfhP [Jeotgalicoccus pinnipedialis]